MVAEATRSHRALNKFLRFVGLHASLALLRLKQILVLSLVLEPYINPV
jgi:hypothetical protein